MCLRDNAAVWNCLSQPCELWEIDTRHDHVRQIDLIQIGDTDRVQNQVCTIHARPDAVRQWSLFQVKQQCNVL